MSIQEFKRGQRRDEGNVYTMLKSMKLSLKFDGRIKTLLNIEQIISIIYSSNTDFMS